MQLHPTRINPLPPQAELVALQTRDGFALRGMKCGSGANGKGTILILGGRSEYLERYFETMSDLAARGFCIASFDWRGQGGSQRLIEDRGKGHIISFKSFDEDLRCAVEDLLRAKCPGPYYALAHSTGGNVILRNLISETWFSRAIISAPLLEFRYGHWPKWVARLMSYVAAQAGLSYLHVPGYRRGHLNKQDFERVPLTSDRGRYDRDIETVEQFPELATGGPTLGWLNAAMESNRILKSSRLPKGLRCPTMIITAGREAIVDNRGVADFCAGVPGIVQVTIRDSLHEMMMERDAVRAQFFAAVDQFLRPA
jgi:lysophospholipase